MLRLATAHSVVGRMLMRARSKLALERLVVKPGGVMLQEVRAASTHLLIVRLHCTQHWVVVECTERRSLLHSHTKLMPF